jgi:hypothetical protein
MIFIGIRILYIYNYTFDSIFMLSVGVDVLGRQMAKKLVKKL